MYAIWNYKEPIIVNYTVEHYKQNLDGTYSQNPDEIETLSVQEGTTVAAAPKSYEGYTAVQSQREVIAANEQTVLRCYYERNTYKVIVNKVKGIASVSGEGEYKYGEDVNLECELIGEDKLKNLVGGDIKSCDPNAIQVVFIKILRAYDKPIEDVNAEKEQPMLDQLGQISEYADKMSKMPEVVDKVSGAK